MKTFRSLPPFKLNSVVFNGFSRYNFTTFSFVRAKLGEKTKSEIERKSKKTGAVRSGISERYYSAEPLSRASYGVALAIKTFSELCRQACALG